MAEDIDKVERARLARKAIIDHMDCDDCTEDYVFLLRQGGREFGMGLTTVLSMLAFAEHEGAVPPLSTEWWIEPGGTVLAGRWPIALLSEKATDQKHSFHSDQDGWLCPCR